MCIPISIALDLINIFFPKIGNNTFTHSLGRKDYGEGVGPVEIVFSSDGH